MASLEVPNAYFAASASEFVAANPDAVLGELTRKSAFAVDETQRDAWRTEISLLKQSCSDIDGTLFLEFDVPRLGSRIDAVLLTGSALLVLEFKVGAKRFNDADAFQAWDYALDLKNFHLASRDLPIYPILVATEATAIPPVLGASAADKVFPPMRCSGANLRDALQLILAGISGLRINSVEWATAPYHPTPTIIEAARALYAHHTVEDINTYDASKRNLAVTSKQVEAIIDTACREGRKAIVFVTGVPGAGKTLIGLNVATKKRDEAPTHAVFLSGNGPLVKVLREALVRDDLRRRRAINDRTRRGVIEQPVKQFIQNVHHFRDEGLNRSEAPSDRVVIFDEAQRAWNREMTMDFMKRKKGRPGFTQSEPEFLLSYMNRHEGWAVVVCLVGGGQEINRGEAGISAWLEALATKFPEWSAYISPNLSDSEYAAGNALQLIVSRPNVVADASLHLSVSMRSFRAEHVSRFVKAVLDHEETEAADLFEKLSKRYQVALTRDLSLAKSWVRQHARGTERFGLVASSKAKRLKPEAVDVRYEVDPIHWFLNDRGDTRSSYYLEDAATEFQVQGLELDWACVAWDADFRFASGAWSCHSFSSLGWRAVKNEDRRSYLRNAYRVLLTRARQGMVIYVPKGDASDPTRAPQFYDGTFGYLKSLGLTVV